MTCLCEKNIPEGTALSPKCIKDIWLFSEFESEDLAFLRSLGRSKVYRRGDAVFHQGDAADAMFLIKSGRIKLSKIFEDGREAAIVSSHSADRFMKSLTNPAG